MPLIIICGYPSAGKTHRARQILQYCEKRISDPDAFAAHPNTTPPSPTTLQNNTTQTAPLRLRTHHISDATLHLPRSVYAAARTEKDARASLYSAVKRALSPADIVVLDSGNYIKGWRYQLFCEAKALGTPCCVVHVGPRDGTVEGARGVNEARLKRVGNGRNVKDDNDKDDNEARGETGGHAENDPYDPQVWEELVYRFEEPNPMARWDSPLFTVPWDDAEPPCAQIWGELVEGKGGAVRMNLATVLAPATAPDHLYILDRTTQLILAQIQTHQRDHPGEVGGCVLVDLASASASSAAASPSTTTTTTTTATKTNAKTKSPQLKMTLPPTPLSTPYLQRLRRQFIAQQRTAAGGAGMIGGKMGSSGSAERVGELFVRWLGAEFGTEDDGGD